MYLNDSINHDKISKMSVPQLKALCRELRSRILHTVCENGGHLSSNLGTVELTVALHYVFDVPRDKILWDVGHQSYAHKLLTGRCSSFGTLRKRDGISGFTRRGESEADAFISGHSSTSVSAALGIAAAMRIKNEDGAVAAVIGDGAFTGGMAYEGINNAGKSGLPLTLILNDNAMSIGKSTGAFARYLAHIRSTRRYYCAKEHFKTALSSLPLVGERMERAVRAAKSILKDALYDNSTLFENLGFAYIGPVFGHDLENLIEALSLAKLTERPCVVHVFTRKGKGFKPAEDNPGEYHAVVKSKPRLCYSEVFGRELERLGKLDGRICAVTAAMKYATGLNFFKDSCPARFFDAGIAEQHSVTFAAGLAAEGMLPVFAVYSTFLQRGFDQMIHDCAIENTHVVLAVDRAGFVGEDGETHQGVFDVPMLRMIPNAVILAPASFEELRQCLKRALYDIGGVAAVRYPKGCENTVSAESLGAAGAALVPARELAYSGKHSKTLAVSYGRISAELAAACAETGADILRLVRVSPVPESAVDIAAGYERVVFFEEGTLRGGAAEGFAAALLSRGYRGAYETVGVNDRFVPMGTVDEQLEMFGLDREGMARRLRESR